MLLFGVHGSLRTLAPGRRQVNIIVSQKREHSRKPDEQYKIIERCSPGPYLDLFSRGRREGWDVWGNQTEAYTPSWPTYANHSHAPKPHHNGTEQQVLVLNERAHEWRPAQKRPPRGLVGG
jgi:hypothetical protein